MDELHERVPRRGLCSLGRRDPGPIGDGRGASTASPRAVAYLFERVAAGEPRGTTARRRIYMPLTDGESLRVQQQLRDRPVMTASIRIPRPTLHHSSGGPSGKTWPLVFVGGYSLIPQLLLAFIPHT